MSKEFRLGSDPLSRLKDKKGTAAEDAGPEKTGSENTSLRDNEPTAEEQSLRGIIAGSSQEESERSEKTDQQYVFMREKADEMQKVHYKDLFARSQDPAKLLKKLLNIFLCFPLKCLEHHPGREVLQVLKDSRQSFSKIIMSLADYFNRPRLTAASVESILMRSLQSAFELNGLDLSTYCACDCESNLAWHRDRTLLICLALYEFVYSSLVFNGQADSSKFDLRLICYTDSQGNAQLVCQHRGLVHKNAELSHKSMTPLDLLADIFVLHEGGLLLSSGRKKLAEIRFIVPNTSILGGAYGR